MMKKRTSVEVRSQIGYSKERDTSSERKMNKKRKEIVDCASRRDVLHSFPLRFVMPTAGGKDLKSERSSD